MQFHPVPYAYVLTKPRRASGFGIERFDERWGAAEAGVDAYTTAEIQAYGGSYKATKKDTEEHSIHSIGGSASDRTRAGHVYGGSRAWWLGESLGLG